MTPLPQDAKRTSLLFQYGVLSADDVVSWADSWIQRTDSPPGALLELSTMPPAKTGDILSCLHRLSAGADLWIALRGALPRLCHYIASHRHRAESIANHLYLTVCSFDVSEVPDDLHFAYRFDDAFSLAHQGIYGDPETVCREFIHELDKFSEMA